MRRLSRVTAAAVLAAALAPELVDAQCAMCRSVLASPEGQRLVAGLRHGIVLLLAAPFAIFATVAYLAVREQRKRHMAGGDLQSAPTETPCPLGAQSEHVDRARSVGIGRLPI